MELNKVYNMDCLEGLKRIKSESVDCIITDPPYNINLKPQRGLTDSIANDNMSEEEFKVFLDNTFKEVNRILKDDSFLVIFTGWSTIPLFRSVLDKYFDLKSMPIWIKNNFGIGYYTRPQYEPCFLYFKGNPPVLDNPVSDVWKFDKILAPIHSCEKPKKLMRFIVNTFTKEGDLVCDPFSGAGSTLIACKDRNRQFIGFELEEKYCNIIKERLNQNKLGEWFK